MIMHNDLLIVSDTCHLASCCLNSEKLFPTSDDQYCNPKREFEPGSSAANLCEHCWQLKPLGHHGLFMAYLFCVFEFSRSEMLFYFVLFVKMSAPDLSIKSSICCPFLLGLFIILSEFLLLNILTTFIKTHRLPLSNQPQLYIWNKLNTKCVSGLDFVLDHLLLVFFQTFDFACMGQQ